MGLLRTQRWIACVIAAGYLIHALRSLRSYLSFSTSPTIDFVLPEEEMLIPEDDLDEQDAWRGPQGLLQYPLHSPGVASFASLPTPDPKLGKVTAPDKVSAEHVPHEHGAHYASTVEFSSAPHGTFTHLTAGESEATLARLLGPRQGNAEGYRVVHRMSTPPSWVWLPKGLQAEDADPESLEGSCKSLFRRWRSKSIQIQSLSKEQLQQGQVAELLTLALRYSA
ncbi:hypothetical protein CYMTET_32660, partial [Cymbomonas tetramitiformis]